MWDRLIRAGGWYNTLPHAMLTLGAGYTKDSLAKLHDQNILTDEEFQQKKAEILAKM